VIGALAMTVASTAGAASLQKVSNWGGAGLPSGVSMYIYVPDKVVATPPVLALIHYCGGSASAVFGQAQGGGLVSAADKYGFIMVVPDNGARCWDVESNKTWTRSGGGDSDAIKQMVTYALSQHNGNASRVYSTGDSSGAMMTELLLALYPDIFVGGSAFAGMPAGCRGTSESSTATGYSGACAGGTVMHTGAQWGAIVDMMNPGYTGHRPRVQLFHGSADTTISPTNFTQAIVEWTDVLGLSTNPMTTTTVTLGQHQATRQQWQDTCGGVVLDAFLSMGGDHGPSDTLFNATYVVPFLGLDQTGAVDPEIAKCGGGAGGAGGKAGPGGSGGANSGGGGGGATGGHGGGAGSAGTGGMRATGGTPGSGGSGSGGVTASGGAPGSGGVTASGGVPGSGGRGAGTGGSAPTGAAGGDGTGGDGTDSGWSGCNCGVGGSRTDIPRGLGGGLTLVLALAVLVRRRRRIGAR
jgi:poly(hydroxyalkanoate) depolymerase family esterase